MNNRYNNFRTILKQFHKEIEDLSRREPVKYLSVLALSSIDSEREPQAVKGNVQKHHLQLIEDFYLRLHKN